MFNRYLLALFLILPAFGFSQYNLNYKDDGSISVLMHGSIGQEPDFEKLNSLLVDLGNNITKELVNKDYSVKNEKVILNNDNTVDISLTLFKSTNTSPRFIEVRFSAIFTTDVFYLNGFKTDNPKGDAINNFRFNRTPQLIGETYVYKTQTNYIESNTLRGINSNSPNREYNLQLFADYISVPGGIATLNFIEKIKSGGTCFTNINYKNLAKQDRMSSVLPDYNEVNETAKQERIPLPEIDMSSSKQSKNTQTYSQNDKLTTSTKSESVPNKPTKYIAPVKYYTCGLEIKEQANTLVGNLKYIPIEFINHSKKKIDNIDFTIYYYNIYGELLETKTDNWETGIFTDPIKPNFKQTYRILNYISSSETAKKYIFKVNRVHYTDNTSCYY